MKSEEIARIAGVSRSTVSRVLNNYSNVPESTREKVMKVVKKYNYQPNTSARTLAGKKNNTIGVFFIITGAREGKDRIFNNDFFASYLNAIVDSANSKGYYVLVQTVVTDTDYERINQIFLQKRIDGGILIGTQDNTFLRIDIPSKKYPFIVFDYSTDSNKLEDIKIMQHDNLYFFNTNEQKATWQMVKLLIDKGHKNIGFIKGNHATKSARDRYRYYTEAMKHYKLKINNKYIIEGEFIQNTAYEEMKKKAEKQEVATAYICANDDMALAAMQSLKDKNYKIPDDVSFTGYDNIKTGQLFQNKLTTIAPDYYEMAKKAVETIINDIDGVKADNKQMNKCKIIEFESKILLRDSISNVK